MVHGNVFHKMGRSAIEFTNARNDADGNLYQAPAGPFGFGNPYLRVKTPEPAEWHNLTSWRDEHGWDKNGALAEMDATLDPEKLELTMKVKSDAKPLPAFNGIDTDFFGHTISGERGPGPFADLGGQSGPRPIDPRRENHQ